MAKQVFYVILTDMFCGELNYGSVSRYAVMATTERGAAWVMSRYLGIGYRCQYEGVWHSETKLSALDFQNPDYLSDWEREKYQSVNFGVAK